MKTYRVILAPDFMSDLFELYHYVRLSDGKQKAKALVKSLEKAARRLQAFPDRGHQLPELISMGIQNIQEIIIVPYRIIYKVQGINVHILACIDGRRDIEQILIRRSL